MQARVELASTAELLAADVNLHAVFDMREEEEEEEEDVPSSPISPSYSPTAPSYTPTAPSY